jgi:hypothetical protein
MAGKNQGAPSIRLLQSLLGTFGLVKSDSPSSDLLRSRIPRYGPFRAYSGSSDFFPIILSRQRDALPYRRVRASRYSGWAVRRVPISRVAAASVA